MSSGTPQTPIELITSSPSNQRINPSIYNQLLRSPLNPNDEETDPPMGLGGAFNPNSSANLSNNNNNNEQNVEFMISNLIILLDDPSNKSELNKSHIKTILQKSLIAISHYKLQNEILRFENNESYKRNGVETDLIKSQVDYLLKSPFKPSSRATMEQPHHLPQNWEDENDTEPQASSSATMTTTAVPNSSRKNTLKQHKITKPRSARSTTKTLKLVEKFPNNGISSEFNDCIKVFHLEKN